MCFLVAPTARNNRNEWFEAPLASGLDNKVEPALHLSLFDFGQDYTIDS